MRWILHIFILVGVIFFMYGCVYADGIAHLGVLKRRQKYCEFVGQVKKTTCIKCICRPNHKYWCFMLAKCRTTTPYPFRTRTPRPIPDEPDHSSGDYELLQERSTQKPKKKFGIPYDNDGNSNYCKFVGEVKRTRCKKCICRENRKYACSWLDKCSKSSPGAVKTTTEVAVLDTPYDREILEALVLQDGRGSPKHTNKIDDSHHSDGNGKRCKVVGEIQRTWCRKCICEKNHKYACFRLKTCGKTNPGPFRTATEAAVSDTSHDYDYFEVDDLLGGLIPPRPEKKFDTYYNDELARDCIRGTETKIGCNTCTCMWPGMLSCVKHKCPSDQMGPLREYSPTNEDTHLKKIIRENLISSVACDIREEIKVNLCSSCECVSPGVLKCTNACTSSEEEYVNKAERATTPDYYPEYYDIIN